MTTSTFPTHWTRVRLGWLFAPVVRKGHASETVLSVYRDFGIVPKNSRTDNFNRTPTDLDTYQLVQPGDVVVNRMKAWQGSLAVSSHRGIVSPDYEVLRSADNRVDSGFIHHLLRSRVLIEQYAIRSTGIRPAQWRLYWDQMKTIEVWIPPVDEQRRIAAFLDLEISRIDALVSKQERLIGVLSERRVAVVKHAIGSVFARHGRCDKLGRRTRIGNGATPRREEDRYWSAGTYPWLNSSVVNLPEVRGAAQHVTAAALKECHLPRVRAGSLLVGLTGQGKTRGMATLLLTEATINQHLAYVTPDPSHWDSKFLLWALRADYRALRAVSDENGSTKGGLTCEDLKRHRVPHASLEEQREIANYLDEQTAKIDLLISKAQRFIALAKERRTALITAAVTGKIDVRDKVA